MNKLFNKKLKKRFSFCVLAFLLALTSWGQVFNKTSNGVQIMCYEQKVCNEITFYSSSTVRVLKYSLNQPKSKWKSLSVTMTPQATSIRYADEGSKYVMTTDKMMVQYNKETGTIQFFTHKGTQLLAEKSRGSIVPITMGVDHGNFRVKQNFTLDKDEAIYGLGLQQDGKMNQRNMVKRLVQENTEDYVGMLQSVKGYGLFWDNYSPTVFTDNKVETSFDSEVGDWIDYYFMYGGNADGVVASMRELTGQVPMLPLSTYGYWQSRERYKSQDELVGTLKHYRDLKVPIDGVIQDYQYWGIFTYVWNAMDFLATEQYPHPQQMMDDIHNMHGKCIISIWPTFGPMTHQYEEFERKDMLYESIRPWPWDGTRGKFDYPVHVKIYDAFNPEARDIYWKYLQPYLFNIGVDGWWMDSTEPNHERITQSDYDTPTALGSYRKVCNAYPLVDVGGVDEHQKATSKDKRVFILTRSAFAGMQRYGENVWTGDIHGNWDVFHKQLSAGLNFSLCGFPYWNTDIGGFYVDKTDFPKRLGNASYRELYTRWLEFATFCPMMRSHGTQCKREIYQFGKKGTPYYDAIEKYINIRYSLLPYIYSTSWDVTTHQATMTRPLCMDFAHDKKVWDIGDEYLFGRSILVAPVTQPMYNKKEGNNVVADFSQVKQSKVYLPANTLWYDFWTNEPMKGGHTVAKAAPLDIMPLYVKAGSILPIGPQVQYSNEKPWDNLLLKIYPGANADFCLYEDEGDNYNYEKGAYTEIPMHWNDATHTLTIGERKGSYKGMLTHRQFVVRLVNGSEKTVDYNGQSVNIKM